MYMKTNQWFWKFHSRSLKSTSQGIVGKMPRQQDAETQLRPSYQVLDTEWSWLGCLTCLTITTTCGATYSDRVGSWHQMPMSRASIGTDDSQQRTTDRVFNSFTSVSSSFNQYSNSAKCTQETPKFTHTRTHRHKVTLLNSVGLDSSQYSTTVLNLSSDRGVLREVQVNDTRQTPGVKSPIGDSLRIWVANCGRACEKGILNRASTRVWGEAAFYYRQYLIKYNVQGLRHWGGAAPRDLNTENFFQNFIFHN